MRVSLFSRSRRFAMLLGLGALTLVLALAATAQWVLLTGLAPWQIARMLPAVPTATSMPLARPHFQTGIAFPRWGVNAYGPTDTNYAKGLDEIATQTGARWIELAINLSAASDACAPVVATDLAPTPASLAYGIRLARTRGLRVFVVPFITVAQGTDPSSHWSGNLRCSSDNAAAWFAAYAQTLRPYWRAAAQAGASQIALATEVDGLLYHQDEWVHLLYQAAAVFPGAITYDMNFTAVPRVLADTPLWLRDPHLAGVGVSAYYSLADRSQRLNQQALASAWRTHAQLQLDTLASMLHHHIILSEAGYPNRADAGYLPYEPRGPTQPRDLTESAACYGAVVPQVLRDSNLYGLYAWGWAVPGFGLKDTPAAHVLSHWYRSPQA